MRFNLESRAEKYAEIAEAIGTARPGAAAKDSANACIAAIEKFAQQLGLRKNLGDLGASQNDVGQLVEDALQDITMRTNPRKVMEDDARAMFEAALK
jgi:alcohol dehydrogenase